MSRTLQDKNHQKVEFNAALSPIRPELAFLDPLGECIADYSNLFREILPDHANYTPLFEKGILRGYPAHATLDKLCDEAEVEDTRGIPVLRGLADLLAAFEQDRTFLSRVMQALEDVAPELRSPAHDRHMATFEKFAGALAKSEDRQYFTHMRDELDRGLNELGYAASKASPGDQSPVTEPCLGRT